MKLFVIGALAFLSACKLNQNSCTYRCQHDAACQDALAADGIVPGGSRDLDAGLCNGICASLRTQARAYQRERRELGVDKDAAPWTHPAWRRRSADDGAS
jgi:hypothetical protein